MLTLTSLSLDKPDKAISCSTVGIFVWLPDNLWRWRKKWLWNGWRPSLCGEGGYNGSRTDGVGGQVGSLERNLPCTGLQFYKNQEHKRTCILTAQGNCWILQAPAKQLVEFYWNVLSDSEQSIIMDTYIVAQD